MDISLTKRKEKQKAIHKSNINCIKDIFKTTHLLVHFFEVCLISILKSDQFVRDRKFLKGRLSNFFAWIGNPPNLFTQTYR